jgi:predicted dithiol-disulfide oxidoreductase (DUF899 family)
MSLPEVATYEKWRAARVALLEREKQLTRERDELNAQRRRMPMVRIEKDYVFEGPEGEVRLLDMFEGRRQLILGHFMFDPSWQDGCPSCSAGADEVSDGLLEHLAKRDTTVAYVSRAPLAKIEDYKRRKGWTFPWYSSFANDFNYDFHVTLDASVAPIEYNFRGADELREHGGASLLDSDQPFEEPGTSFFLLDGRDVYLTNSTYARGAEMTGGSYYWLDLTALGRQEDWEEPKDRSDDVRSNQPDFAR